MPNTVTAGTERPMTIGAIARRSGFTVKALHFYERRGLLPPAGRSRSGYRLYAETDLHRLAFIRQARTLGLALDAIRELVATRDGPGRTTRARLLRILAERIAQTDEQIAVLTRLRKELERRRRTVAQRCRRAPSARGYCACLRERRRPEPGPLPTPGGPWNRSAGRPRSR